MASGLLARDCSSRRPVGRADAGRSYLGRKLLSHESCQVAQDRCKKNNRQRSEQQESRKAAAHELEGMVGKKKVSTAAKQKHAPEAGSRLPHARASVRCVVEGSLPENFTAWLAKPRPVIRVIRSRTRKVGLLTCRECRWASFEQPRQNGEAQKVAYPEGRMHPSAPVSGLRRRLRM